MGVFQLKTVANLNEPLLLLTTFRLEDTYFWYTFRLVSATVLEFLRFCNCQTRENI